MLVKITIPVFNYEKNGIFYQDIYFDCKISPSKEETLNFLNELHVRDSQYPEYTDDWVDCINSVTNTIRGEWPSVGINKRVSMNVFIHREDLLKFADFLSLNMSIIHPKVLRNHKIHPKVSLRALLINIKRARTG